MKQKEEKSLSHEQSYLRVTAFNNTIAISQANDLFIKDRLNKDCVYLDSDGHMKLTYSTGGVKGYLTLKADGIKIEVYKVAEEDEEPLITDNREFGGYYSRVLIMCINKAKEKLQLRN